MSLFTRLVAPNRIRGSESSRVIYMDAPLTIRASQIDEIASALVESSASRSIAVYVNGRRIEVNPYSNITDSIYYSSNFEPIRSISFHNNEVDVWLAWAASAQSKSADANYLGTLWRVQRVLEGARWPFGTFLVRYWGAFIAVLAAILVILFSLDVRPPEQRDAIAVTASVGAAVVLITTALIAATRRVRLDIHARNERSRGGLKDFVLQVFFIPGATLMLSAVWPLVVSWWTAITGFPSP
jgi:hypothetical protein